MPRGRLRTWLAIGGVVIVVACVIVGFRSLSKQSVALGSWFAVPESAQPTSHGYALNVEKSTAFIFSFTPKQSMSLTALDFPGLPAAGIDAVAVQIAPLVDDQAPVAGANMTLPAGLDSSPVTVGYQLDAGVDYAVRVRVIASSAATSATLSQVAITTKRANVGETTVLTLPAELALDGGGQK